MKRFILSDLHIGHNQAQYSIMEQTIQFIRETARPGDQVWGLGDWFHILEGGLETCLNHPMTQRFKELAGQIPIRLIPGNHDRELERFRDRPELGNPLSPIQLVRPFAENDIWYCHGYEFDPTIEYLPPWVIWLWNKVHPNPTPSHLREKDITEKYLIAVYLVYLRASKGLMDKNLKEGRNYRGIVMGHTHLPFYQQSPALPFLLDDGDMRHSGTFVVRDDSGFYLQQWDGARSQWNSTFIRKP